MMVCVRHWLPIVIITEVCWWLPFRSRQNVGALHSWASWVKPVEAFYSRIYSSAAMQATLRLLQGFENIQLTCMLIRASNETQSMSTTSVSMDG